MLGRISFTIVVAISLFCAVSYGDFPQLHRALPGANGKPGYRASSSGSRQTKSADIVGDNSIQNKQDIYGDKRAHADYHHRTMELESTWSQAAFYSIISCSLVGLSGILPLIIIPLEAGPSLKDGAGSIKLKLLLSFAVGSLLGDVFLHLLPESWATVEKAADPHWAHTVIGLWVVCGILSFMAIEKVFGEGGDEEEEVDADENMEKMKCSGNGSVSHESSTADDGLRHRVTESSTNGTAHLQNGSPTANGTAHHNGDLLYHNGTSNGTVAATNNNTSKSNICEKKDKNIHITGYLNLLANFIDNFTHGLAVAGSYLISPKVGLCTTIAILLHEVPHEVGDFAILLRSGFDRWKAAKAQMLTATGGLLGALTALMSDSAEEAGDRTAAILPFTAGGFIYIALVNVVPELLKEKCPKESIKQMLCVMLGVCSMMLVTVIFDS